jgi:hypothetical protein
MHLKTFFQQYTRLTKKRGAKHSTGQKQPANTFKLLLFLPPKFPFASTHPPFLLKLRHHCIVKPQTPSCNLQNPHYNSYTTCRYHNINISTMRNKENSPPPPPHSCSMLTSPYPTHNLPRPLLLLVENHVHFHVVPLLKKKKPNYTAHDHKQIQPNY